VGRLLYVLFAFNIFTYQNLDNLDGQQARKTGTSSALGQLFDHGCDAVNITLSTATLAATLQLPLSLASLMVLCGQAVFFFATWEEYHTKEMYLGMFNGADEGVLTAVVLYLATAVCGPAMWENWTVGGVALNHILLVAFLMGSMFTVASSVVRAHHASASRAGKLRRATPFLVFVVLATLWIHAEGLGTGTSVPLLMLCLCCCFAHFTCRLILAHVCGMEYTPIQPGLFPPFLAALNHYGGAVLRGAPLIPPGLALPMLTCAAIALLLHYSVVCVRRIAGTLGIACFSIQPAAPV